MARRTIGTIFVDFDANFEPVTRGQKQLKKDATSTALNIEDSFRKLGVKSSAEMNLMRAKITNSFNAIKQSGQAAANDILRAEKAKNDQLRMLDEQQFGRRTSMIEGIKKHWLAATAAITAAYFMARRAWNMAGEAADYEERINSLDALGRKAGLTGQQIIDAMKEASRGLLSMVDAANMAASALNLSLTAKQMIEFTRVAEQLTDVIGGTIPEVFNRMAVAAASGRLQTLAQMGILMDLNVVYKKHAESVDRAVDTLTEQEKQQVRLNAILEAAKAKVADLGAPVDTTRDKMDRMVATLKDLQLTIGQGLVRAALASYGAFQYLAAGILGVASAYAKLQAMYYSYSVFQAKREKAPEIRALGEEYYAQATMMVEKALEAMGMAVAPEVPSGFGPPNRGVIPPEMGAGPAAAAAEKIVEDLSIPGPSKEDLRTLARPLAPVKSDIEEVFVEGRDMLAWYADELDELDDSYADFQKIDREAWQAHWNYKLKMHEASVEDAERLTKLEAEAEEDAARVSREAWQAHWNYKLKMHEETVARMDAIRDKFRDIFSSISDAFSQSIRGVILGTQTMEQAFRNMAQNIALSMIDNIIKRGLGSVADAMSSMFFGARGTATGGLLSGIFGGIGKLIGFQEGGVVPGPVGAPRLAVVHGGEEVLTPEERQGRAGASVVQLFNVSPGVPEAVRREVIAMLPLIKREALSAVLAARNRGGNFAHALGARG